MYSWSGTFRISNSCCEVRKSKFHKRMNQWSWWLHLTSVFRVTVTHIGVLPEGSLPIRKATEDQYLIYQTRSYHTFTQGCDYEYRLQTKSIPVSLYKIRGQLCQPNFWPHFCRYSVTQCSIFTMKWTACCQQHSQEPDLKQTQSTEPLSKH